MATIPSILAVVAGQRFRAIMYNGIKTYLDFLADQPHLAVAISADVTAGNGSSTVIPYDAEFEDSDTMHSAGAPSRLVATTAGRYSLNVFVMLAAGTYTQYDVNIRVNSGGSGSGGTSVRTFSYGSPGGSPRQFTTTIERYMGATDYFEIFVIQTSGGAKAIQGGNGVGQTGVQMRRVGNS